MTPSLALVQAFLIISIPLGIWLLPVVRKVVPLVVLQIAWGFVLGSALAGTITAWPLELPLPSESSWFVDDLAFYGVLLFVFVTGTHLESSQFVRRSDQGSFDTGALAGRHEFWPIAISSLLVPMTFGVIAAAALRQQWPHLPGPQATDLSFLLVLGLATGITALPVLSAILIENNHINTAVGRFVLATATVHDAALWIFLTFLLVYTDTGNGTVQPPLVVLVQMVLCTFFLLVIVRRLLRWLVQTTWWAAMPAHGRLSVEIVGLLLAAYATESIGVHYLIGAVLYGASLPDSRKKILIAHVEPVVVAWILPFYFVTTGMHTKLDPGDPAIWAVFVCMATVKVVSQLIGTTLPLRIVFGRPWSFALQSGIYMTCAGIVEIVVLGLAYERGLISNTAYVGMIFSALFTTAMTKPFVAAVQRVLKVSRINELTTEP